MYKDFPRHLPAKIEIAFDTDVSHSFFQQFICNMEKMNFNPPPKYEMVASATFLYISHTHFSRKLPDNVLTKFARQFRADYLSSIITRDNASIHINLFYGQPG